MVFLCGDWLMLKYHIVQLGNLIINVANIATDSWYFDKVVVPELPGATKSIATQAMLWTVAHTYASHANRHKCHMHTHKHTCTLTQDPFHNQTHHGIDGAMAYYNYTTLPNTMWPGAAEFTCSFFEEQNPVHEHRLCRDEKKKSKSMCLGEKEWIQRHRKGARGKDNLSH